MQLRQGSAPRCQPHQLGTAASGCGCGCNHHATVSVYSSMSRPQYYILPCMISCRWGSQQMRMLYVGKAASAAWTFCCHTWQSKHLSTLQGRCESSKPRRSLHYALIYRFFRCFWRKYDTLPRELVELVVAATWTSGCITAVSAAQ